MQLTPEQEAIRDQFTAHPCLVINAGPGCGKSTTLGIGMRSAPRTWQPKMKGVAFNRDAAKALQAKMPAIDVCTLNSLGLSVWNSYCDTKAGPPNTKKTREIINGIRDAGHWSIPGDQIQDILDIVAAAKTQGYGPRGSGGSFMGAPSYSDLCHIAGVASPPSYQLIDQVLRVGIEWAFQGVLDFDDQIYMPTCFADADAFEPLRLLAVDEAQDLSPLQLRMLKRFEAEHYVFVGDPLQAIYAFRGAMSDAMDRIYDIWPSAVTLPLQTSFRLPQEIVSLLHDHNPDLTTLKQDHGVIERNNIEGAPTMSIAQWMGSRNICKPGLKAAILCRNNAPLFRVALACIATRTPFTMANKAFGAGLIRDIKYVTRSVGLRQASSEWTCAQLYTHWFYSDPQGLERDALLDRYQTCVSVAERTATAEGMCLEITSLNRQANPSDASHPLYLSTAHKAKGLEFDWVCHLDPHLIPSKFARTPEQLQQEANVGYVINSRSLHTLVFLNSNQILIPGVPQRQPRPGTKYKESL